MNRISSRLFVLAGLIFPVSAFSASNFTQPTPDELKMTSDPAAPGAAAVYLFREETADDQRQMHTLYARIKILTEAGREQFSDITMPYEDKEETIRGVEARTIHSDGTVIPFTGKPWQKEIVKGAGLRYMEKGFSMPDVQVGSILEYRYETTYSDWWPPRWHVQQPVLVHRAHYHFVPGAGGNVAANRFLPADAQITENGKGWDLVLNNVPPMIDEDDSPPMHALGYRVLFYYVYPGVNTPEKYWETKGQFWSKGVDDYAAAKKLKSVVGQIIAPGDSDDVKLHKIYAAVMKIENMKFIRDQSEAENKAEKLKFRNAEDIWQQQRGYEREITMVFLGLVRAAGFKAYAMFVTDRDQNVFMKGQLDWDQLDDEIVIVNVAGKDLYFDPGERYCEYGKLQWTHTWTMGVRQTDQGTEIAETPFPLFTDTTEERIADLAMDADGSVRGSITMTMTGALALRWRQEALESDEEAAEKKFGDEVRDDMPEGVTVKMSKFRGLTDYTQPLTAVMEVSGTLGSARGRRMFLPGTFFEARAKARFVNATRENPVYLHYSWTLQDVLRLKLPPNAVVEVSPSDAQFLLGPNADFVEKYKSAKGTYEYGRLERVAGILYQTKDYPGLRDFFQKINAQDQQPMVLKLTPAADPVAPGSGKE
ncbi:MAG: DUF3857 domain-containing protein [Acidobacteriaceae bacterium]